MNHLPLFLEIKDRPVLVVGGGEAAARRVETVLKAGGRVTVVAIEAGPALKDIAKREGVDLQEREFRPAELKGRFLVFVAPDAEDLHWPGSALAPDAGIPATAPDRPALWTLLMPRGRARPLGGRRAVPLAGPNRPHDRRKQTQHADSTTDPP